MSRQNGAGPEDIRKPVQTPYMRRNSIYNPEYLDPEHALVRFTPLIESLTRRLRRMYGRYQTEQDLEDLRSEIQMEFLRLHSRYDPARGVDFPGYISMNLARRANYFVQRTSKKQGSEVLSFGDYGVGYHAETVTDEKAEKELDRINKINSIPLERVKNETFRDIITHILIDGDDVHALAERYQVSPRSMAAKIDAAGRYIRMLMEQKISDEEKNGSEGDFED